MFKNRRMCSMFIIQIRLNQMENSGINYQYQDTMNMALQEQNFFYNLNYFPPYLQNNGNPLFWNSLLPPTLAPNNFYPPNSFHLSHPIPHLNMDTIQPQGDHQENSGAFENITERNIIKVEKQTPKITSPRSDSQDSYHPESPSSKPTFCRKNHKGASHRRNRGQNYYWSDEENRKYFEFVEKHLDWFRLKYQDRTTIRINVEMSKKIRSRTSIQCHNHHQKMLRRHDGLENLVLFIKEVKNAKRQAYIEASEDKIASQ